VEIIAHFSCGSGEHDFDARIRCNISPYTSKLHEKASCLIKNLLLETRIEFEVTPVSLHKLFRRSVGFAIKMFRQDSEGYYETE
jgi:hypothetical protein